MKGILHRRLILFLLLVWYFPLFAQVNHNAAFPPSILKIYDSLKRLDNLEEWLLEGGQYIQESPVERLPLLRELFSKVWRTCHTDGERMVWFSLLNFDGYYQLYTGRILASIDAYEKAYKFYNEKPIKGAELVEYCLKPLGNNYTRLGDYERAFYIQEKSLEMLLGTNDSVQAAAICNNLAISSQWNGDLRKAKYYVEKGLELVLKGTPTEGLLQSVYADILLQLHELNLASIQITRSVLLLEKWKQQPGSIVFGWLAGAYITQANIYRKQQKFSLALSSCKKAETIYKNIFKNQRIREQAKLDLQMGDLYLQWNKPEQAIGFFHQALQRLMPEFVAKNTDSLPGVKMLYSENTIADALDGKAKCFLKFQKNKRALEAFSLSFLADAGLRQHFYSRSSRQQQQAQSRSRAELAIAAAVEAYKKTGDKNYAEQALLFMEKSKAQLLYDDIQNNIYRSGILSNDSLLQREQQIQQAIIYQQRELAIKPLGSLESDKARQIKSELDYELSLLQKQLKEKYPVKSTIDFFENILTARQLFEKIPPGKIAVEFFVGDSLLFIAKLDNNGILNLQQLDSSASIKKQVNGFVNKWFKNGSTALINEPREYYRQANEIYQTLFIGDIQESYIIVPDGVLGHLPFDALITHSAYDSDPGKWPYLVKKATLCFSYSLQTLQPPVLQNKESVFNGFFIATENNGLEKLPAVELESKLLKKSISGSFYQEQQATRKQFVKSLSAASLLHISTHSFLSGVDSTPALRLADGDFFLFELYGRSFHPQLLVLSTCRTADGLLEEGEGIISLSRGFTAAGAEGVLSGLWNLNDDASARLVASFYKHLLSDSIPSLALRQAKLEWLKEQSGNPIFQLPYYWAGLVYTGNDAPVRLSSKEENISWIWGILALLSIGIILTLFGINQKRKTNTA